jgi:hypothetical protein
MLDLLGVVQVVLAGSPPDRLCSRPVSQHMATVDGRTFPALTADIPCVSESD